MVRPTRLKGAATFSPGLKSGDLALLNKLHREVVVGRRGLTTSEKIRLAAVVARLRIGAAKAYPQFMSALAYVLQEMPGASAADKRSALALIRRASLLGYPHAMAERALSLTVKGHLREGIPLLKKAASKGEPRAQEYLGILCLQGPGVRKDPRKAEVLLRKAQAAGSTSAAFWLGLKRDFFDRNREKEAARWYLIAAQGGEVGAMVNYGVCAERGQGVKASAKTARVWFHRAAALGDPDGKKGLARLIAATTQPRRSRSHKSAITQRRRL